MRKVMLIATVSLLTVFTVPTHAMPIAPVSPQVIGASDLIEVKGGHGHGHGWGRGHGHRHYGWSRGRKVGWRGHHCPPGHWKKGWC